MASRILLIEDSIDIAGGIRHNLEYEGYVVLWGKDGATGLELGMTANPDLVILDLMLPDIDGYQVLRRLRERGLAIPVIILSARTQESDRVKGFRLDADQYMTKPFGLVELLERVRSVLRRAEVTARAQKGRSESESRAVRFGEVEVKPAARQVYRAGREVPMAPRVFDLMMALVKNEGKAVSRTHLLRDVWGYDESVTSRTIDTHISDLRQAIEVDPASPLHVHTVRKVGYRFER